MNEWILDWELIHESKEYIVGPLNLKDDGSLCIHHFLVRKPGWEVKRLLQGCYAALPFPSLPETKDYQI